MTSCGASARAPAHHGSRLGHAHSVPPQGWNDECALSASCRWQVAGSRAFPAAFRSPFGRYSRPLRSPSRLRRGPRHRPGAQPPRGGAWVARAFAPFRWFLCSAAGWARIAPPGRGARRRAATPRRCRPRAAAGCAQRGQAPALSSVGSLMPPLFRQPQRTPACRWQRLRVGCRGRPARTLRARSGLGRAARRASRSESAQSDGLRALSCMHARSDARRCCGAQEPCRPTVRRFCSPPSP